jgi:hypothetical protein
MKIATVVLALAITACAIRASDAARHAYVGQIWEHIDGEWVTPPPALELDERLAPATLLRFDASGTVWIVNGTLIDQQAGLTISEGDPVRVSSGTWIDDGTIRLQYKTVYLSHATLRPEDRAPVDADAAFNGVTVNLDGRAFSKSRVNREQFERVLRLVRNSRD